MTSKRILWVCLALAYVTALSAYKSRSMDQLSAQASARLGRGHSVVANLFQSSFYFFYDDQFWPGIQKQLSADETPRLKRIEVLSSQGTVLFDSKDPHKPGEGTAPVHPNSKVVERITQDKSSEPVLFSRGFELSVLVPGEQFAILYSVDASGIRNRIFGALAFGLILAGLLQWMISRDVLSRLAVPAANAWSSFWRLRVKFLFAIVLINLLTALIVFVTLVRLQTREQTQRIETDSTLFSQFSTAQVVSNFTNYFYFYYSDRFIPEMKRIIASNENLVSLRIVSKRTGGVLYDSESSAATPSAIGSELIKADFSTEIQEQLKGRDLAVQHLERGGEKLLSIVTTFRNENQDALFWVEYLFNYQSLSRGIQAIRKQILWDLVPSLGLGLLIAAIFAQLLIRPIRRLVDALGKVTAGDYDVEVKVTGKDEISELVVAFNSMTEELRKKQELRKYLSDSTYRQVMSAPESAHGAKVGGSRVSATILFTDIRNFVGHCENLEAEEVTAMLNEYFSVMVDVVYKHGGEVDKFIGDALLAVFYTPPETDTARRTPPATALQAVYCALEMREKLVEFNRRREERGKSTIEIGAGITHGEIISGPIGSKDRMDFTVIGDVVNLANRIEKLSKKGKYTRIVFSHQVEEKVRGLLDYDEMGTEKVRGKEDEVRVYELIGVRDIDALVGNLKSSDPLLRRRSVELLGQSRNLDALPHLLKALGDSDEGVRLQSVLSAALLGLKDESVFEVLCTRLKTETSEKVVSALIASLGKLSTEARVDELIAALSPFLESSVDRVKANAVEALGLARSPRCADLILPQLGSRNNRVKANAAMALFASGHVEVIDTLKPMLMHSDVLMRSSAAFAIGELTLIAEQEQLMKAFAERPHLTKMFLAELQECVPMLVTLLRDPEPMVRRQAVVALGKIKDRSAVLPMLDLLDPSAGSKELLGDISQALRSIGSHQLVREVITRLSH